jgi:hypothetical protein
MAKGLQPLRLYLDVGHLTHCIVVF